MARRGAGVSTIRPPKDEVRRMGTPEREAELRAEARAWIREHEIKMRRRWTLSGLLDRVFGENDDERAARG